MMSCNVGKADRAIRVVIGAAALGAGWHYGSLLGLVGLVPFVTGLTGRCPAYLLFGVSTCGLK